MAHLGLGHHLGRLGCGFSPTPLAWQGGQPPGPLYIEGYPWPLKNTPIPLSLSLLGSRDSPVWSCAKDKFSPPYACRHAAGLSVPVFRCSSLDRARSSLASPYVCNALRGATLVVLEVCFLYTASRSSSVSSTSPRHRLLRRAKFSATLRSATASTSATLVRERNHRFSVYKGMYTDLLRITISA